MRTVTSPNEEFAAFYRVTVRRTFRIAYRMARGDLRIAWDATQETYTRIFREWNIHDFSVEKRAVCLAVRLVADLLPDVVDDEREMPDLPLVDAVREIVDRQPVERRAVAILFFLAECDLAEIADFLGIPEPAVRDHVEHLRVLMKPLVDGGFQ